METATIKYTLKSKNTDFVVVLHFNQEDFSLVNKQPSRKDWTRLGHHKCCHCPLEQKKFPFCPLASAIEQIISKLQNFPSYERMQARVEEKNRIIISETTVQTALSSLLGLIIPASGCPHTAYFRPMSRFHLPFADTEETIYRTATMFLLSQYFMNKDQGLIPPDFSRLETIYSNIHTVNKYTCKRLREISEDDCYLNAIVILDMYTISIHSAFSQKLAKIESYFSHYSLNESILLHE
jgi:hypothetical protein